MKSIWAQSCEIKERESLRENRRTEIAVIGAGMAGILTAYALQKAGKKVIVLEADRIAGGQTRGTTAKITSQHGLIYHRMAEKLGKEKARLYAMANEQAVEEYRNLIARERISCDFEETYACIYSDDAKRLKREAETAAGLGLPASFVSHIPLPVLCAGAVRFERQAQFHPLKFIRAVSGGLTIYERTAVRSVEENTLITDNGRVEADKIVFACHYPFVNFPGMYFARMHQERSYVLALENAARLEGMFIGEGQAGYSFRSYGRLLLFGGENHRTGEDSSGNCYRRLRERAATLFPACREAACWSAQDCITPDGIPYIGQYSGGKPDWYAATGFGKWGMTTSMVSANLIKDLICGKENPYAKVFAPGRFAAGDISQLAANGKQAVKGLIRRNFAVPDKMAQELPSGQGGVVLLEGKKAGVYKDKTGKLYPVDIRCPHLGCQLEWNPDELSWDCPCHGSRFDYHGNLIDNPAQEGIGHE